MTIIDEWQGRGLGTALTSLLAERAREEGIDRFTALLLAGNEQMHDVLASIGPATVLSREAGTVEVEVDDPRARHRRSHGRACCGWSPGARSSWRRHPGGFAQRRTAASTANVDALPAAR